MGYPIELTWNDVADLQEKAHSDGFEAGYAAAVAEFESGDLRGASFHLKSFSGGDCS